MLFNKNNRIKAIKLSKANRVVNQPFRQSNARLTQNKTLLAHNNNQYSESQSQEV
ncbi:hypothetical protein M23134_04623 [Microscilla marina ATCC 23134]|uniref:Uncharacterized protein n=1 Tax=Microscilla marina ATCC 23134 TaxID=313606 RepID=A1ZTC3_MICM2|nr:hypothetical protein M23134_04623 [Microscilla marina ATCC 23134]